MLPQMVRRRARFVLVLVGAVAALGGLLAAIATRRRGAAGSAPGPDDAATTTHTRAKHTPDAAQQRAQMQVRLALGVIAGVIAFMLLVLSALRFLFGDGSTEVVLAQATWLLLGGGVTLGLALLLAQRPAPPRPTTDRMRSGRVRFRWLLPGLGLLGLLAVLNGGFFGERLLPNIHYHLQMLLFIAGLAGTGLGLAGVGWWWRKPAAPARRTPTDMTEWRSVAFITLAALFIRAYGVETLLRTWRDETLFADAVFELWENPTIDMLIPVPGISSIIGTFPYLQTITMALFGNDLVGLRMTTALLGALTVPGVYVLGRALFNRKTALIAAVLLAAFPPHIHFSRLALYNIADPLFGTWALALVALGLRDNRRWQFAAAGVMLGLTHYFYEGGRLLYTPLVGLWLVALLVVTPAANGRAWRKHLPWNGLLTFGAAFFIVVAPLYYTWVVRDQSLSPRLDEKRGSIAFVSSLPDYWVTLTDDFTWADAPRRVETLTNRIPPDIRRYYEHHLRPPLLQFVRDADGSGFYYGGQTPLLLVYTLPFALFGLFYLLWRPRSPGALLLALWVLLTILGNSLIDQNNWTPRFVVVFPALALLVAVGIVGLLALLVPPPVAPADPALAARRLRVRTGIAVGVTVLLAVGQVIYYFGPHLTFYNRQIRAEFPDYIDIAYRARDLGADTKIIIVTNAVVWEPHFHTFERLWGIDMDWSIVKPVESAQYMLEFVLAMPEDEPRPVAVFVEPADIMTQRWLTGNFPVNEPTFSDYDIPVFEQYALYYLPAEWFEDVQEP